jgi:DNA (cytosine-5)-methyltransferase 1
LARWVGERLLDPQPYDGERDEERGLTAPWPRAAWGLDGHVYRADFSAWPVRQPYESLKDFLKYPVTPLSARATEGFLRRARASSLKFVPGFLDAVGAHLEHVRLTRVAA